MQVKDYSSKCVSFRDFALKFWKFRGNWFMTTQLHVLLEGNIKDVSYHKQDNIDW